MGVRAHDAHDGDRPGKLAQVARDVGRAAGEIFLFVNLDDGHRRFGRNPADPPPDELVEHQVADDEDAFVGEAREEGVQPAVVLGGGHLTKRQVIRISPPHGKPEAVLRGMRDAGCGMRDAGRGWGMGVGVDNKAPSS